MTYSLEFDARALKEWRKLGEPVRQQLKKKLVTILENPKVEANRLSDFPDCYKVKLRSSGYRLVYQVVDQEVVVFVLAVGQREREEVYRAAAAREIDTGEWLVLKVEGAFAGAGWTLMCGGTRSRKY